MQAQVPFPPSPPSSSAVALSPLQLASPDNRGEVRRIALLVFLALVLGIALGAAMTANMTYGFGILGLGLGVVAVCWRTEALILIFLLLTCTIVDESSLPNIGFGAGSLKASHVVMGILLIITIIQVAIRRKPIFASPLNLPILLFCLLAVVETGWGVVAVQAGIVPSLIWLRTVVYYALFFVIVNMVNTPQRLRFLIDGTYWLGVFVAVAMIIQAAAGSKIQLVAGRVEALVTQTSINTGITRILPPGQFLIQLVFFIVVCRLVLNHKVRWWDFLALGAFTVSLILMFGRAETASIFGSLFLIIFVVPPDARKRYLLFLLRGTIVLAVILAILMQTSPKVSSYVTAFSSRIATIFTPSEYTIDGSLNSRKNEDTYAWQAIHKHPIMGIGLGGEYRYPFPEEVGIAPNQIVNVLDFIHNGYLMVQLKLGSGGTLLFVIISLLTLWRGLVNFHKIRDPYFAAVLLAGALTYLQFLPRHFFTPVFMYPYGVPIVAIILGTNELILAFNAQHITAEQAAHKRQLPWHRRQSVQFSTKALDVPAQTQPAPLDDLVV